MSDFPLINGIPAYPSASPLQVAGLISTSNVVAPDYQLGTNGPLVKSSIAARAARQGLGQDGTAASSTSVPAYGTSDFTASAFINTDLTVNVEGIFGSNSAGGFGLFVYSTGQLGAQNIGIATVGSSTGTISANKTAHVVYTRSGTTGTFYINGVSAGTITDSTNYAAVTNLVGNVGGLNVFKGSISGAYLYNRALSAAEVVSLYEAGVPSGSDFSAVPASNTNLAATLTADIGSPTIAGNQVTFSGASTQRVRSAQFSYRFGNKVSVTAIVTGFSGTRFNCYFAGGVGQAITANGTYTFVQSDGTTGTNAIYIDNNNNTAGTVTLTVTAQGLLLAPDAAQPGNGLVWTDLSGNGAHIVLPTSGVSWNVPGTGPTRIRGTTSTNGNQAVLNAAIVLQNYQITRCRARSRTGTPTVKIGTSAGAGDIVAAVALSTAWQNLTLLSAAITSSGTIILWANSTSTDLVEWDFEVQPLSF